MLTYAKSVHDLAAEQIADVLSLHDEALRTGEVTGRMQALIKNVIENQRSVLDYTAQAVANKYRCQGKTYWMAAKRPARFADAFDKNLPGVRLSDPKIAQAFERHQPYQPAHDWVLHLFALSRENKHHRLTPQVGRDEVWPTLLVRPTANRSRRATNRSRIMEPTVVRVRWDFENPRIPVLETLRRIQAGVREAADHVCSEAGL